MRVMDNLLKLCPSPAKSSTRGSSPDATKVLAQFLSPVPLGVVVSGEDEDKDGKTAESEDEAEHGEEGDP